MATRNNSSPYILPRRSHNSTRPGTFISTRNLSTLHIQPRPTPFLSGTTIKASPQPLRVVGRIIDPMTLGSARQILLAPASTVLSSNEQHSNVQPVIHESFQRPLSRQQRAPMFKLSNDHSEEDELDLDEVYRLLDESAGFRAQELGIPRRRERLNNLSPEEKMNRRKHKNRIAAQAARDRKKVNTHRLEESLRRALIEIGQLRGEVNLLKAENARLEADNQTIRFGQERTGSNQRSDTDTFQRHSKEEPMHFEEHLPPQRKYQRQFRAQPVLNHHQSVDVKPSFLVRPAGKTAHEQAQPQHKSAEVGQRDSVGSAASFYEPLQRERESSMANRSSGSGRPKGTEKKAFAMACAHGVVAGGEDVELQKIFDELFEDFDFPVDVDRFCNEVIEEGIAEPSDAFGAVKTDSAQQQQANYGNGCVPSADEAQSQAQSPAQDAHNEHQQWALGSQQCRFGGGQQQLGIGCRAAVAAALSPHNYFVQQSTTPAAPSSVCAPHESVSSSESVVPSTTNNIGSSPSYQKVPSPCLSTHSTYIDEFASSSSSAFDDGQHQFAHFRQTDSERDPLLSSIKQEYFDQFDDHPPHSPSYGFEESTEWMMNNEYESLGAEESCTLEEEPTMEMSEDSNGEYGQNELLYVDGPISLYAPPSSHFASDHSSFSY